MSSNNVQAEIHPTAIIDPDAHLASNVKIGPFCCIGAGVTIGSGTRIESHVVIKQDTVIGVNNHIYSGAVLGEDCQHRDYRQQPARLVIGDHNIIREFCTIHRGSMSNIASTEDNTKAAQTTRIGSHNFIMLGSHIAHDCVVGDYVTMANHSALAGHVVIGDYVNLAGYTLVHQFCHIGSYATTGINTIVTQDIPAFIKVAGNPSRVYVLNSVGMKRHGFDQTAITRLKAAYRKVYRQGLALNEALEALQTEAEEDQAIACFTASIRASQRGIIR